VFGFRVTIADTGCGVPDLADSKAHNAISAELRGTGKSKKVSASFLQRLKIAQALFEEHGHSRSRFAMRIASTVLESENVTTLHIGPACPGAITVSLLACQGAHKHIQMCGTEVLFDYFPDLYSNDALVTYLQCLSDQFRGLAQVAQCAALPIQVHFSLKTALHNECWRLPLPAKISPSTLVPGPILVSDVAAAAAAATTANECHVLAVDSDDEDDELNSNSNDANGVVCVNINEPGQLRTLLSTEALTQLETFRQAWEPQCGMVATTGNYDIYMFARNITDVTPNTSLVNVVVTQDYHYWSEDPKQEILSFFLGRSKGSSLKELAFSRLILKNANFGYVIEAQQLPKSTHAYNNLIFLVNVHSKKRAIGGAVRFGCICKKLVARFKKLADIMSKTEQELGEHIPTIRDSICEIIERSQNKEFIEKAMALLDANNAEELRANLMKKLRALFEDK